MLLDYVRWCKTILVWAETSILERISAIFGLKLNKDKCVALHSNVQGSDSKTQPACRENSTKSNIELTLFALFKLIHTLVQMTLSTNICAHG